MNDALYGPDGFYRSAGAPGRHFRTAAHTGAAWPAAIGRLVEQVDTTLGFPTEFTVVEVGAGHGELLAGLGALAPPRWELVGVDVAARPAGLPDRVGWQDVLPESFTGVLLAMEWLDVVPIDVVELTERGPCLVEVSDSGLERIGPVPSPADSTWLARWWPLAEVGDRAEVGRTRDDAWRDAVGRLRRGAAVAVDYAAVPERDLAGTLTGFRAGRQVLPVPDGSMDITAHVLFESVAAGTPDVESVLMTQREALRRLGVRGDRPSYDGDPAGYLDRLSRVGAEAELLDPGGLGAFTWLVQSRGVPMPIQPAG